MTGPRDLLGMLGSSARDRAARPGRAAAMLLVCALVVTSARSQTLTPLLVHGPRTNRINVVVLSEGYTAPQLSQFLRDATNVVETLLTASPYAEYRQHFNAYAISVASAESGSDHPTTGGPFRNTYFNSAYEFYDYVITIPPNGLDPNPANGQGRVEHLINTWLPEADIVILLVNDIQPGGSSGVGGPTGVSNRRPIITALNPYWPYSDIVVHESGHFFAGLVDEYSNPYPGYTPVEAPNATQRTNRNEIPWRAWIEPSTPLPTPNDGSWADVVGLFEGAQYQATGWYRPKFDCKMRTLGMPFCEVCREQIIRAIYARVRPWDGVEPASSVISWTSAAPVRFRLDLVQPRQSPLAVEWKTNGVGVPGAAGPELELSPEALGNGTHTVEVWVRDPTPWVRTDPEGRLRATRSWQVQISIPELRLVDPEFLPDGRWRFTVLGTAGGSLVLEMSTDLRTWQSLATNAPWSGRWDYTNTPPPGSSRAFYRAVRQP
ncbi:M64 family metallopeptidase [Limisphaera sp. VF-2]|jgi:hypothetical protein|uniref:M64 family metallopeptidase n=1 Tax=Limisphaera sp. VF-2 TaxID=3400418 RepID=UPI00176A1DA9